MSLILGAFHPLMPSGVYYGSWRLPGNEIMDFLDLGRWLETAKRYEAAGLDFIFFADGYGYPALDGELLDAAPRDAVVFPQADPMPLVSAVAAVTQRLGFVVTAATSVDKPQALARRLVTLDNLTNGRIGWNIVTGAGASTQAQLFGEEPTPHDQRYEIADDYVQLTLKLWESSWDPGALVRDVDAGVYADPSKIHHVHHHGPYFRTDGVLAVPPGPQRTPLLLQAGTSGAGKEFAARYAELVFLAGGDPETVAANIKDIKARAVRLGRTDGSIKFVVGAGIVVAPTSAEAAAKRAEMLSLSTTESAAAAYAFYTGLDLLKFDQDRPLPTKTTNDGQTNVERFTTGEEASLPTVAEILEDFRLNGVNGSVFVGSPSEVADQMEEYVAISGADGFLIQTLTMPGTYDDVAELVMPELRTRGLVDPPAPTASAGALTLRERLFGEGQAWLPSSHPGAGFRNAAS